MDCLNPAAKGHNEPGLLGNDQRRSSRGRKLTNALLALLSILFVVLLGVVIWLGVEVHKCRNDIDSLRRTTLGGSTQSAAANTASLGSTGSTAASASVPLYLSKNATSATGYAYSGSLYRCDSLFGRSLQYCEARALRLWKF